MSLVNSYQFYGHHSVHIIFLSLVSNPVTILVRHLLSSLGSSQVIDLDSIQVSTL